MQLTSGPAEPGASVIGNVVPPGAGGDGRFRAGRRRWPVLAALAVVLVAVVAVVVLTLGGGSGPASHGVDNGAPVSYQTVARQTLTSQTDQTGTLGYSGSYTVSIPTGTEGSVLSLDLVTVQIDKAKGAADERTLAAARKLARPQNADTLSAAEATVASDKTGLAEAKTQLADDRQLGCPASSSSTVTTALGGSSPSNGGGNDTNNGDSGSASSGSASPTSSRTASRLARPPAAHVADSTGSSSAGSSSAQTGDVDGTSSTGATLTGSVTPDGADTS